MLTDADREIRRGRITASTAAACLGLCPYVTPLGAWLEITGRGRGTPTRAERLRWERGHVIEPALVDFAARQLARDLHRVVTIDKPGTVAHPSIPWAASSVDALVITRDTRPGERPAVVELDGFTVTPPGLFDFYAVEGKTVYGRDCSEWGREFSDEIPQHVAIQCEWELLHYPEATAVVVPALVGDGLDLRIYVWRTCAPLRDALVDALGSWHARHVVADVPPPARIADDRVLARVWKAQDAEREDDPRIAELAHKDARARALMSRLEKHRKAYAVEIKERMREATACRGPWGEVTWRETSGPETLDRERAIEIASARGAELLAAGAPFDLGAVLRAALDEATTQAHGRMLKTAHGRGRAAPDE